MFPITSTTKSTLNMSANKTGSLHRLHQKVVNHPPHFAGGAEEDLSDKACQRQSRRLSTGRTSNQGKVSRSASTSEKQAYRCFVNHSYHDHAHDPDDGNATITDEKIEQANDNFHPARGGPRGGVSTPFPEKLHEMLSKAESEMFDHIVSWHPHGRSFAVHQPKRFVAEVMPRFFKQSKLTSFQRQLNLYGFSRLTAGPDRGGYYHELFLRGRLHLCKRMIRTRVKGTGVKAAASPSTEPNFRTMEPCYEEHNHGNGDFVIQSLPVTKSCGNLAKDESMNLWMLPSVVSDETGSSEDFSNSDCEDSDSIISSPLKEVPDHVLSAPGSPQAVMNELEASVADMGNRKANQCPSPLSMLLESSFEEDAASVQPCHSGDEMLFEGQRFHYLDTDFFLNEDEDCGLHDLSRAPTHQDECIPSFVEWHIDDTLGELFIT